MSGIRYQQMLENLGGSENRRDKALSEELGLPAGFDAAGHTLTLGEAIRQDAHIALWDAPSVGDTGTLVLGGQASVPESVKELVVERIEQRPDFSLGVIGRGILHKEDAIREVRAGSAVGRRIVAIEQESCRIAVEEMSKKEKQAAL